jgi:lipopolysaccharide/colanic/teichoic acid biosynthesis glycosyltransferase
MIAHSGTQAATLSNRERPAAKAAPPKTPLPPSELRIVLLPPSAPPSNRRPSSWYIRGKVILDIVVALILFTLSLPVMLLTALLLKLTSRGPVLYSQIRLGLNGRPFSIYKIRTMVHNCESSSGACWSRPGDPRITRLGHILRATHLDELPQLWNILRGDMSLVGPRPERPEFMPALEHALPNYRARLLVRPGITGLAQVQLPPDSDVPGVRRKLAHDLYYIRHLSWWLDLRILACTVLHLFGIPCHNLCRAFLMTAREALPDEKVAC